MVDVSRRGRPRLDLIETADLIPDGRLDPSEADLLDHDAIARGVAEIALAARTPVNIALFGAWGSGKSSVYTMITNHLDRVAPDAVRVARYDAWKYGGQDLKRNFVSSVAESFGLGNDPDFAEGMTDELSTARLNIPKWLRDNRKSLGLGMAVAVGIAVIWSSILLAAAVWLAKIPLSDALKSLIPATGVVFGAALVAVLVGPQALQGAVVTKKTPAPSGADQFAQRFGALVSRVRKGRVERLIFFIDELDRCTPEDVVATLIDLKTFLDQEGCVFIVAADREVIEQSLRKAPQAKPVREDEPYFATPGAFLDKIFQHQIALPPLRARALTRFAQDLVRSQNGLWKALRDHGPDTFDLAIFALVPVHVRSPRRVKILLNNFATTCRIAEARGIAWRDRAHELAVLTVLQTEFPSVAEELRRVPRLLVYLRGDEKPEAAEVQGIVRRFRDRADDLDEADAGVPSSVPGSAARGEDPAPPETPAGELLSDDISSSGNRKRRNADLTLRRHLSMYLAKVRAARITDPRPDLLYLQSAVNGHAMSDPHLGDVIDFATDTAPDDVVLAFAEADSPTLAAAASLLVVEGDNSYGPGRGFAYESACRLIEKVDPADEAARQTIAKDAAPSLIAAVRALSLPSMPGALLAACWARQEGVVTATLDDLSVEDVPVDILGRIALLYPYLQGADAAALASFLSTDFGRRQGPLTTALVEIPIGAAVALWESVAPAVHVELSHQERASTEMSTAAASSVSSVRSSPDPAPSNSGVGAAMMRALTGAIRARPDHEELLSAIVASAQAEDTFEPVRAWVLDDADSLVATMVSPVHRTRHGLLGLLHYPLTNWAVWATYLADNGLGDAREDLSLLATRVVLEKLFHAVPDAAATDLEELPRIAERLRGLAELDDRVLSEVISEVTSAMEWEIADPDDPNSVLAWQRKRAISAVTLKLSPLSAGEALETLALDLIDAVETLTLDDQFVAWWLPMAQRLPEPTARYLSDKVDSYVYENVDPVVIVRMKHGLRQCCGGTALPASELAGLPEGALDSTMVGDWLSLSPSVEDVRSLIGSVPCVAEDFDRYCGALRLAERTQLWISLWESKISSSLLDSAARHGIGSAAVEAVRKAVASMTNGDDRSSAVDRLRVAKPPDDSSDGRELRRATSEFALDLLKRGTKIDEVLAARLVIWAGGAGHGHTVALRTAFTAACAGDNRLAKEQIKTLEELGLVPPEQKKGFLDRLMGR
ncbi:P-loop NTPase fold protein [Nocardia amikacinitolerans]|uniref:KAP family P-loop NTPase fold protein n=1 Tax=Nocardia amikacinitolerans TaxID=756689 RepID=UPI003699542C